jgi:hypothetical protein
MPLKDDTSTVAQDQWKVIIEKLPVPVLVSEGRIEKVLLINRKFVETFGYDIEECPMCTTGGLLPIPTEPIRSR